MKTIVLSPIQRSRDERIGVYHVVYYRYQLALERLTYFHPFEVCYYLSVGEHYLPTLKYGTCEAFRQDHHVLWRSTRDDGLLRKIAGDMLELAVGCLENECALPMLDYYVENIKPHEYGRRTLEEYMELLAVDDSPNEIIRV